MIQPILSRRDLLLKGSKLSVAGVAALGGIGVAGFGRKAFAADPSKDADILNVVLGLEHQVIAAYQIGADSGLLKEPLALNILLLFQSHHKTHRDTLAAAIEKLGGTPVAAQVTADYAKSLNAASLKSQEDILELALKLEHDAATAYIGVIPSFEDRDLARTCARMAADEAMHWTALLSTVKPPQPLPVNAMTFGS